MSPLLRRTAKDVLESLDSSAGEKSSVAVRSLPERHRFGGGIAEMAR
jgi:hypothetical protein